MHCWQLLLRFLHISEDSTEEHVRRSLRACEATDFSGLFPGIDLRLLTLGLNFRPGGLQFASGAAWELSAGIKHEEPVLTGVEQMSFRRGCIFQESHGTLYNLHLDAKAI